MVTCAGPANQLLHCTRLSLPKAVESLWLPSRAKRLPTHFCRPPSSACTTDQDQHGQRAGRTAPPTCRPTSQRPSPVGTSFLIVFHADGGGSEDVLYHRAASASAL